MSRYLLIFLLVFSIALVGCGSQTKVDVTKKLSAAESNLENGDLDGAYENYVAALSADPTNTEANFGAAILGILKVAVDENTRNLASKFNVTLPTNLNTLFNTTTTTQATSIINLSVLTRTATSPVITPSEVQTYIKNTLIPALDTALARLVVVEANPDFKFIITTKMSKASQDREIDLGEIYALDMLGSFIKAGLHEAIAYNWDYSTSNPLDEATFGTLKSDGSANMAAARDAYIRMFAKWADGINFIAAETDDQSDDCIPKFSNPEEKDKFLEYISLVKNSLENGATTIEVKPGVNLVVDFKTFYSTPIADWKVYINGAKNNFPEGYDFTFNGLFPELTTFEKWNNFIASLQ
jgi:hypothetical protein